MEEGVVAASDNPFFGLRTLKNGADATPRRRTARRATPATAIRAGRPPRRTGVDQQPFLYAPAFRTEGAERTVTAAAHGFRYRTRSRCGGGERFRLENLRRPSPVVTERHGDIGRRRFEHIREIYGTIARIERIIE